MKYSRRRMLEEYLNQRDFVSLDELCEAFGVSKNTVRRDVAGLVADGLAEKVYGGLRPIRPAAGAMLTYGDRAVKNAAEKQYIGALAARFVQDRDVIFLDSGTTAIHLLPHIAGLSGVTVLTNSLHVLTRCMEYPGLNTITFGGQLNPKTASFSSNFCSMENLQSFNINKAFMGATGVSVEKGATNSSPGELPIKKSIVEQSDERYLLADSAKFGKAALLTYASLAAFQVVVTDRNPGEPFLSYFEERGIRLVTE